MQNTYSFLWQFFGKYKYKTLLLITIMSLQTIALSYVAPSILKTLINYYENSSLTLGNGAILACIYVICISIEPMFVIFKDKMSLILQESMKKDVLLSCYSLLSEKELQYFTNKYSGDLTQKLTVPLQAIDQLFSLTIIIIKTALFLIAVLFVIAHFNFWISIISLAWVVLSGIILKKISVIRNTKYKTVYEEQDTASGLIADCILNIENVKAFAKEKHELQNTEQQSQKILDAMCKSIPSSTLSWVFNYFVSNMQLFIPMAAFFYQFIHRKLNLGDLMFLFQLLINTANVVRELLNTLLRVQPTLANLQNALTEILKEPSIKNKTTAKEMIIQDGKITIKNLTFSHK